MIGNDAGPCPCCGALPIDWVDNPFKAPASTGVLVEALTPSAATKAAYIGEFGFNIVDRDEDGDEVYRRVLVPWDTIKEIMAAIAARQALSTTPTPASDGVTNEWRDINDAPHSTPIIAQYHEWNDPNGALAEHVVWFYAGGWRPYPMTVGDSYAERWKPLPTPTPDRFGEGYRAGVEAGARALHAAEDSWNDYAWEYLPETVQQSFRDQAETVIRALQPATGEGA